MRNTNAKNTEVAKLVVKFVIPKSAASMILGPRGATWQANVKNGWEKFSNNCQWIGLRENLQETIDFPIKYVAFL